MFILSFEVKMARSVVRVTIQNMHLRHLCKPQSEPDHSYTNSDKENTRLDCDVER